MAQVRLVEIGEQRRVEIEYVAGIVLPKRGLQRIRESALIEVCGKVSRPDTEQPLPIETRHRVPAEVESLDAPVDRFQYQKPTVGRNGHRNRPSEQSLTRAFARDERGRRCDRVSRRGIGNRQDRQLVLLPVGGDNLAAVDDHRGNVAERDFPQL